MSETAIDEKLMMAVDDILAHGKVRGIRMVFLAAVHMDEVTTQFLAAKNCSENDAMIIASEYLARPCVKRV